MKEQFILSLHTIGAIQFGKFRLKSGVLSPIYLDLRLLSSHPHLLKTAASLLLDRVQKIKPDLLCPVPYTAIPIATLLSTSSSTPMCLRRKETKSYGLKKKIEGSFQSGDRCLIIDDVISSGQSIIEVANDCKEAHLIVHDALVLIDREQNGHLNILEQGIVLHALFSLSEVLSLLEKNMLIEQKISKDVLEFMNEQKTSVGRT